MVDLQALRATLAELPPDVSSSIAEPPAPEDIYAPPDHAQAIDPDRSLIVGARGMGKSFLAAAYTSDSARKSMASLYPRLRLDDLLVVTGFSGEILPSSISPGIIQGLLEHVDAELIWRGILLDGIHGALGGSINNSDTWKERIERARDVEYAEGSILRADRQLQDQGKRLVFVFDALDKLANNWPTIRELTRGLMRTALEFRVLRGIRFKIFLRPDQYDDSSVFSFPDASKLRAQVVRLTWKPRDLYGLLYTMLARRTSSAASFQAIIARRQLSIEHAGGIVTLPSSLRDDEIAQSAVFESIAGTYMGSDHRRGKTYTWLTNHLMDSNSEVSPRSFLGALQKAAVNVPSPVRFVIDPSGIRSGVQAASHVRLDQLREDHPWVQLALAPLAQQRVPCEDLEFVERWREAGTIQLLREAVKNQKILGPVELEDGFPSPAQALIEALIRLGVLERRQDGRVNMPDIYRVAAQIYRKGGVPVGKRS